jgi:hypothetical protein
MNYKDTILKIDWKNKFTEIDDGENNLNINIPVQKILDAQAKTSFSNGLTEGMQFVLLKLKENQELTPENLKPQLKVWGLIDDEI